ncbi:YcaO-like family protein [Streptomyces coelicoflavus]|uniref:YcaO-like family protein n=1 Tax=Streptomyces coelicoflavus TaxID=285562 RepID=UPI0036A71141
MKKIHFDGTHRVRRPEETWALVDGLRSRFGITRVADVTGLDILGVPVVMAVRPAAKTHPVSPGRGTSLLLARLSAVMKSVEVWHAEYACPAADVRETPAAGLGLPYDVTDLPQHQGSLLTDRTPLDWVVGTDALSGARTLVPRSCVTVDHEVSDVWQPPLLHGSTNGLASGNSYDEAVTHALYEVIRADCAARDCAAGAGSTPVTRHRRVQPASVDDPVCAEVLSRIAEAGARVEIVDVRNRWGLSCFVTYIRSEDSPAPAVGSGVHGSPAVALSRAVTESAQRRLAATAGSGDDLSAALFSDGPAQTGPPPAVECPVVGGPGPAVEGPAVPWKDVSAVSHEFAEDTDEARWLAEQVHLRTGRPPVVVDLGTEPGFSVVKVVAAGLAPGGRHQISRPRRDRP